jgi:arylsulfatase A
MKMRRTIGKLLRGFPGLLLTGLTALFAGQNLEAGDKPNIIVILADDLGYGDLGCYGGRNVKTPNLDRIAREGLRFTDAHSPCSVCTPSRYNLLTGRYAWRTWVGTGCVWANDPMLIEEERETVASLLHREGYFTGCIGKWHLGFGRPGTPGWDNSLGPDFNRELRPGPLEAGFDYFYGMPAMGQHPNIFIENRRVVGLWADDPIRFENDPRPGFQVDYLHRPRTDNPDLRMLSGKSAEYQFEDGALRLTEKAIGFIETHHMQPFFLYFAHRNIHAPLKPNPRFLGTSGCGVYGDYIQELDWSVGRVLATLERLKLLDNTLLIFSSDNGGVITYRAAASDDSPDGFGYRPDKALVDVTLHRPNGPLRGQKTDVWEGGHRVPFVIRWPGHVPAGKVSSALVANTDLLATFAELTGSKLARDAGEDSFSFLDAMLGRSESSARKTLVSDSWKGLFAIREGPWKLIPGHGGGGIAWKPVPPKEGEPAGQLYNLAEDVSEKHNLYAEHPEIVSRLTSLLESYRREGRSRQ